MAKKSTARATLIAARIREARDAAKMSNRDLANATGIGRRSIVRVANGYNEPTQATLEKIARATGKPLDFFRGDPRVETLNARIAEATAEFMATLMAALTEAQHLDLQKQSKVAA